LETGVSPRLFVIGLSGHALRWCWQIRKPRKRHHFCGLYGAIAGLDLLVGQRFVAVDHHRESAAEHDHARAEKSLDGHIRISSWPLVLLATPSLALSSRRGRRARVQAAWKTLVRQDAQGEERAFLGYSRAAARH
jgi:hypothetical protein